VDPVEFVMRRQLDASKRGKLSLWTIYDRPRDFPDSFVARRFEYDKPTADTIEGELDQLRICFQRAGLVCLMRNEEDDPKVVETWL
jgi:hypothetical protein